MKKIYLAFAFTFLWGAVAWAQSVVINKVHNATDSFEGFSDAIELIVIEDHLDMRGLILKDLTLNNASNNDAGGKYKFNNIDFWKDMRSGTSIVLRRPVDASAAYVQDLDASNYKLDLVLPTFTVGGDYFTVLQGNPGGELFNITSNEIVMIKRDDGTANGLGINQVIHAFAIGTSNTSSQFTDLQTAGVPILYASGTTGTGYYQYPLNPDQNVSDYSGTKATSANTATNLGWGTGLGQPNINYIASLRTLYYIDAPTALVGFYPNASSITLNWADNSNNETGFEIEKSTDGIAFTSLATVTANINSYTATGITQSTTTYYRVRALNPSGNSGYTNVFSTSSITPPSVVVNKIFNATSVFEGYSDAIELLVIEDHLDMRGLIVKDISLPDANKDAGGRYQFNNLDFWKDIRSGTTIVLGRPSSASATYIQDTDPSDFKLDFVLPNSSSGSTYFTALQENPGGQYFNVSANDIVIIKKNDPDVTNGRGVKNAIHALAYGNSNTSTAYLDLIAAGVPVLYATGTSGTNSFQYPSNPDQDVSDYKGAKGISTTAGSDLGWGVGFGQNNIDYIESLRKRANSPSLLSAEVLDLSTIKLTWKDNTNNETNFEIERSTDGVTFNFLASVASNVINYSDNTVTAGLVYYYRVRANINSDFTFYTNIASLKAGAGIITSLSFSPVDLFENKAIGTVAGLFLISSPDVSTIATYSLIAGNGDVDNDKFQIVGDQLQVKELLNFEQQENYSVRVKANSQSNFGFENTFTISIKDVNEAPSITIIGAKNTCLGSEENIINLTGISPGPETSQNVTASISSNKPSAFASLSVTVLANGNGEIKYMLSPTAIAETINISLVLQDNGGTANGGVNTYTESFGLTINGFPTVAINSDKGNTVDKGVLVRLTASGGATYQWEGSGIVGDANTAEITVRPSESTTYKVTVTNTGGCSTVQDYLLTITTNYDLVQAANILSPNGDGINDYWKIENIDLYPNNVVKVFDKSGRVIYTKTGYNNEWDGRIAGASLIEDTYFYIIDFGPGEPKKKGFITMLNN